MCGRKYLNVSPTQATRASVLDPWQLWREGNGENVLLLCPQKDTASVVFWPWGGAERESRGAANEWVSSCLVLTWVQIDLNVGGQLQI